MLQELEQPYAGDISVNDAFRPLSRFFDRVWRPEQLPAALLGAMRVLTDPVETGAVTVRCRRTCRPRPTTGRSSCSPKRVWHIARPLPERGRASPRRRS